MFTLILAFDTKSNQMLICFDVLLSMKILRNLTCCNIKLKFCFEMLTPDPLYLRCSQTEGGTITIWRSWRGYLQNTNWSVYFTSTFHFVCFISVGLVCQTHCGLYITSNSELKQRLAWILREWMGVVHSFILGSWPHQRCR